MSLSSREKETIVNFNEAEGVAYVYTCNRGWMSHLEGLGLEPTEVHQDKGRAYAKSYQLPKAWLRKPAKPRRLSPEERERLSLHMSKVRKAAGAC